MYSIYSVILNFFQCKVKHCRKEEKKLLKTEYIVYTNSILEHLKHSVFVYGLEF